MHDLTRLMFDDGATRKPVQDKFSRPRLIRFKFNNKKWVARIIDTVEELDLHFKGDRQFTGQYMYCGKHNQGGPNRAYSFDEFVKNPEDVGWNMWSGRNRPGKHAWRACCEEVAQGNVLYMDITEDLDA